MSRQVASGRSTATNRVGVQDMKSSLSFNGTSSKVTSNSLAGLGSGFSLFIWIKPTKSLANSAMWVNATGSNDRSAFSIINGVFSYGRYNGASWVGAVSSSVRPVLNRWQAILCTFDGTNGKIYINGVDTTTGVGVNTPITSAANAMELGSRLSDFYFSGLMSNEIIFNRALSKQEALSLYNGVIPTGATAIYKLGEGTGPTAYDTSGNGNHGTITSGTYTLDTPTKKRKTVNDNLVYNGDFEYAPPTIAPCTGSGWLDGSAAGSATNNLFGWRIFNYTNSRHAYFDSMEKRSGNYSLKLSTLGAGSTIGVCNNAEGVNYTNIPCAPNTSYTLTFWMKTNYVSGSATSGAFVRLAGGVGVDSTKIRTTTDWTQYSLSVTTQPTASQLFIEMRIIGNDGTATLIMDAWFDDIQLRPTTAVTRGVVT